MSERQIERLAFGGEKIYIEVVEGELEMPERSGASDAFEDTSTAAEKLAEAGEMLRSTISALATTVHDALETAKPKEWTIEINLGFKGKAGIPFVTEGEANGAVKVTAKWVRE